jgi:hypothetical protein
MEVAADILKKQSQTGGPPMCGSCMPSEALCYQTKDKGLEIRCIL